jgi:hypothetical protein
MTSAEMLPPLTMKKLHCEWQQKQHHLQSGGEKNSVQTLHSFTLTYSTSREERSDGISIHIYAFNTLGIQVQDIVCPGCRHILNAAYHIRVI